MGLKKNFILPNGIGGGYVALGPYNWDPIARQATAYFMLYADKTKAEVPAQHICMLCRLRLTEDKFDEYFSKSELKKNQNNIASAFYRALRAERRFISAGGGIKEKDFTIDDAEDDI